MRARSAVVLVVLLASACQSIPAPEDWLPTPFETPEWTYGGWIQVEMKPTAPKVPAAVWGGELIAVSADSGWILTDNGVTAVAVRDVSRATLVGWDPDFSGFLLWSLLGTVSTISNGAFLVATAPMWIIGGSLATASQSRSSTIKTERAQWSDFRLYARFPQGLPPGLDLASLGKLVR